MLLAVAACAFVVLQAPRDAGAPRDSREPDLQTGTAVVSGRVSDAATGAPMAQVTVSLTRLGTRAQLDTRTAANGTFQFQRLAGGSYALTADPAGRTSHGPAGYGALPGKPPGKHTTIVLRDGEVFDRADIALPRRFAISARVVDEHGEPLADMRVKADAFDGSLRGSRTRTTDDRGAVRLWGLGPGAYKVCALPETAPDRPEDEGFVQTCHPAALSDLEAQPVILTDADSAEVEIRMRRSRLFRISGVVIDPNGQIAAGALASLVTVDRTGSSSRTIHTEGGTFTVRGVSPGDYFIKAEMLYRTDVEDNARPIGYVAVNVQAADVEHVVVPLSVPPTIRGRLVFEGGPPPNLRSVAVQAHPGRNSIAMALSRSSAAAAVQADLSFKIEGVVGPSTLNVTAPPGWVVKSVRYRGEERINIPTEFRNARDRTALEIVLTNRPSTLVARVVDERGQPVEDARVLLFPTDARQWEGAGDRSVWRFGVWKHGTYEFPQLRPAEYFVAVLPDGMAFQDHDPRPLEELARDAERITLREDDQQVLDLTIRR